MSHGRCRRHLHLFMWRRVLLVGRKARAACKLILFGAINPLVGMGSAWEAFHSLLFFSLILILHQKAPPTPPPSSWISDEKFPPFSPPRSRQSLYGRLADDGGRLESARKTMAASFQAVSSSINPTLWYIKKQQTFTGDGHRSDLFELDTRWYVQYSLLNSSIVLKLCLGARERAAALLCFKWHPLMVRTRKKDHAFIKCRLLCHVWDRYIPGFGPPEG